MERATCTWADVGLFVGAAAAAEVDAAVAAGGAATRANWNSSPHQ